MKKILERPLSDEFENNNEIKELCLAVRALAQEGRQDAAIPSICQAMEKHPHAPEPHNLLGVVMEKMGDHLSAMKHFRAAWALDPTYAPAIHNLNIYGTFFSSGGPAFDESDLPAPQKNNIEIVYDERGIGHVVKRR